ncbi:MAG: Chaperone SurA precursor [Bacteroidetes bacterium ADurb.Bin408]|nr:MAG: Chaperone SurA precursor [Bacteroidetes bacterium ADurb.Bin408]
MKANNRTIRFIAVSAFIFIFSLTLSAQEKDVLMTIAGENITKAEFLNVYYKNNIKGEPIDKKTLDEYVELFINFKLKVKEAEALGMDTVSDFVKELAGYRKQLAQTLLTDKDVSEKLIKEAYERMQWDIRASHILIRVDNNTAPKDTLEAYNKIVKLRNRILKGEPFEKVAIEASEDQSARDSEATDKRPAMKGNAGDLGYFTALDMVYPFENGAYNTKVGEISMPIRTAFGYHLIKVTDKKPAMGKVQVAHILKSLPKNATEEQVAAKKLEADSLYQKIKEGESFEEIAQKYSDDKGSGAKGGVLPWFGVNRMVPEFIETIAKLKINEVSEPVKTIYGYHIIKLLDRKPIDTYENLYPELKSRVTRDPRSNLSKDVFIARIKKEYNFSEDLNKLKPFYTIVDDSVFVGKWQIETAKNLKDTLFKLADKVFTQQDFATYLFNHQGHRVKENIENYVNAVYNGYVDETCVNYEDSRLEIKDIDFRNLMKEYRDGILLFELTQQKVWSKAINDTVGLENFYQTVKHNYMWGTRLNASIYICKDVKVAKKARSLAAKAMKKGYPNQYILDKININDPNSLKIESNFFSKGDSEIIDGIEWKTGISADKNIEKDVVFVVVHEVLQPEPKGLSDVKGLVTAEYQNYLEKKWIEELRAKYPVKINKDVLSTIN